MLKVGRYTAALLLITVGVLLLLDQTNGSDYLALLLNWWPVLLIMLGTEYLLFHFVYSKDERRLKFDMGGLILAVLVTAAVLGVTQANRLPTEWLKNLDFNIDTLNLSYSSETGVRFEKEPVIIPVSDKTKTIVIDNPNGNVSIRPGSGSDIRVEAIVWVDKVDEEAAAGIAEHSKMNYSGDTQLDITAEGMEYTGGFPNKRKPRMNLTVTVPESTRADYELQLRNGNIEAEGLKVVESLGAFTVNGAVSITDIKGTVKAETTNGAVQVLRIQGSAAIDTTNGAVTAKNIGGELSVDTTNGAVNAEHVEGELTIETLNGEIVIYEAAAGVRAEATNGRISVSTSKVGGDYQLKNVTSPIVLNIPQGTDAEFKGSTSVGSISTTFPLKIDGKKLSGTLGNGTRKIKLETNNRIQVNKIDEIGQ